MHNAASPIDGEIVYRLMLPKEESFIYDSWRRSHFSSPQVAGMRKAQYVPHQNRIIEHLLARSKVVIACPKHDPQHILGYIVCEERPDSTLVVHYVFIKFAYRKWGLSLKLINRVREAYRSKTLYASHMPRSRFLEAMRRHVDINFNPGVIYEFA